MIPFHPSSLEEAQALHDPDQSSGELAEFATGPAEQCMP